MLFLQPFFLQAISVLLKLVFRLEGTVRVTHEHSDLSSDLRAL